MTGAAKLRAWIACFGLAACFGIFIGRLYFLQVVKHEEYTQIATEKHGTKQIIHARRGLIMDCNDEILADNVPVQTVIADGSLVKDPDAMAALLSGPLEMPQKELRDKLDTERKYVVLKRRVSEAVSEEITNRLKVRSMKGIFFEPDNVRTYPNGSMLCHVLGFLDSDYNGIQGIEKTMDEYLRGYDGFRFTERDRTGKELVQYRGQEKKARNGYNVRLTVDMGLQNIVESELQAGCAQWKPKMALAILMRPQTGEILAMANRPGFDLGKVQESSPEAMKNCAVINLVEPGSTFKIVTTAGALNEKLATLDSMVFCENGHFSYAGRVLHDHHGYADLSVQDILVHSSNIGAAKLGMRLGEEKLYEYIRSFGFGERTGIALPGEINGIIHPVHRWSKISITRIPMGQGVAVTPIQTVTAMAVIANGGSLMMPQIVHDIRDEDGNVVKSFAPVKIRQPVSTEVTRDITKALKDVVSARGTAAGAKVPGFTVAGKTGTAQKVDPHGGYLSGKYVVSFAGFLPADDPQIVGLVMFDDAVASSEQNYGGTIAAPVFAKIAEKAARYLNLQPEPEAPAGTEMVSKTGTADKNAAPKVEED